VGSNTALCAISGSHGGECYVDSVSDIASCSLAEGDGRFRGAYCHLSSWEQNFCCDETTVCLLPAWAVFIETGAKKEMQGMKKQ